jgi:flagellar protein FlaG
MASEIPSIATAGAGMAAPRPEAKAPPTAAAPAVQVPEAPKLIPPKAVDIHFDRAEMRQTIQEAVNMLNQQISSTNRGLGFHVDQAIQAPVVTVRSTDTGEVIRQIPNEAILNVAHNIDHMKGLLFNKKS